MYFFSTSFSYTINTPFGSIERVRFNKVGLVGSLERDVTKMMKSLGIITVEMMNHKIDWFENMYDYKFSASAFKRFNEFDFTTFDDDINLIIDDDIVFLLNVFRLLNVPLGHASDSIIFDITFENKIYNHN